MLSVFKSLEQLILFRSLLQDPVISLCRRMLLDGDLTDNNAAGIYYEIAHHLLTYHEQMDVLPDLWQNYILGKMIAVENPLAAACERGWDNIHPALLEAGRHDAAILQRIINFDWAAWGDSLGLAAGKWFAAPGENFSTTFSSNPFYAAAVEGLSLAAADPAEFFTVLAAFYQSHGSGELAIYRAFYWEDGCLQGIAHPDPVRFADLIGYGEQIGALKKNTEAFLNRQGGNHVLLFGDKGTGKSSSVKALLNEYGARGLRMLELQRQQLGELNHIIDMLRRRSGFYIIFIDDLSFEDFEVEYKYLKSHIEGSLQAPAENIRLYVTSNRRHLIRENWGDRQSQDDVHGRETQQEKLSFADRFGLVLTYTAPLQKEYLAMVKEMARQEDLAIDEPLLSRLAIQWELRYHGRSGRTARQFINDLKSRS